MAINTDKGSLVRNSTCTVCGVRFSRARAAKLYCSPKCKQFAYYHRDELTSLNESSKGISDSIASLSIQEYTAYDRTISLVIEYKNLFKKINKNYYTPDSKDSARLIEINRAIPEYLKFLNVYRLSIEEWSFLKLLYPTLKNNEFIKMLDRFDQAFFSSLSYPMENTKAKETPNPIKDLYRNHLKKIGEGKILFS